MYDEDLAHIHHTQFSSFATRAAPELLSLLERRGIRPRPRRRTAIVEVGCGGGVVARAFSEAGFHFVGIDVSPALIRIARATAPAAEFRVAPLERARLPRASAVIAIGEIVTYVPEGLPALQRFFRRVRRALEPGGLLVLDFIESAAHRNMSPRIVEGDGWTMIVSVSVNWTGSLLTRRMRIRRDIGGKARTSFETHRVHIYSREAIGQTLAAAGFEVEMRRSIGNCRLFRGDVVAMATRP